MTPQQAKQDELITYRGAAVKRCDLSNFLTDCMAQVHEIMDALNLEDLKMEKEDDMNRVETTVTVKITHDKPRIQLIH